MLEIRDVLELPKNLWYIADICNDEVRGSQGFH
jgi:hypothetical protein